MYRKLPFLAGLLALSICTSIHADSFQGISGNGLDSISGRNVLTNQHGVSRLQGINGLSRASKGRSAVYSPALDRRINQAENALTGSVDRVGNIPQRLGNDVISIRRQSYSPLVRQIKREIRDEFRKIEF